MAETQNRSDGGKGNPLKWLHWAISLAILLGLVIEAAEDLQGRKLVKAFHDFDYRYTAAILGLSAFYLGIKAIRFQVLLRPFAKLPFAVLWRAYCAGQPATFIPGGVASRAALLQEVGVPAEAAAAPIVYSSLFDQLMFVVTTLLAALWIAKARPAALVLLGLSLVIAALIAIPPSRRWLVKLLERVMCHFKWDDHWAVFCEAIDKVNNWRTLSWTFLLSAVAFITPVFMLQLVLLGLNAKTPLPAVLLSYTLANMAARLTVLPGGLGMTEGGMVGLLGALAGTDVNTAAAAAGLHRIGDSLFQALLGALVYFFLWRHKAEPQATQIDSAVREAAERSPS